MKKKFFISFNLQSVFKFSPLISWTSFYTWFVWISSQIKPTCGIWLICLFQFVSDLSPSSFLFLSFFFFFFGKEMGICFAKFGRVYLHPVVYISCKLLVTSKTLSLIFLARIFHRWYCAFPITSYQETHNIWLLLLMILRLISGSNVSRLIHPL